jgi:endonuclease/exonuclease/phosphatase family metal-dependent hydrolase
MACPGSVRSLARCVATSLVCVMPVGSALAETRAPCISHPVAQGEVDAPAEQPAHTFTIASLNLAGQPQIAEPVATWTAKRAIDILLLQEVGHPSDDGETFVAALSERLGYHFVYAAANVVGKAHTQGLAIVSRYPLDDVRVLPLTYHHLRFKSRCRIALAVTVAMADGPVHLINVHLDTRINSDDRIAQLAPVLGALDGVNAPQLIGGDFNTMNIRWFRTMWPLVYLQQQTAAVAKKLAASGFHTPFKGTPATFKFFHLPLRLDWLYLKDLKPLEWNVDTVQLTDHRGVWARVSL